MKSKLAGIMKRALCILLTLALLPVCTPAEAADDEIMQISFCDIWSGEKTGVEAVIRKEGYYVYPDSIAALCDMEYSVKGNKLVFKCDSFSVSVKSGKLKKVTVQGMEFYRLESLLNALSISAFVYDGELIYNSPLKNVQMLYRDINEALNASYCDANFLKDSPLLEGSAKALAEAYDKLSNLRFSALLGGAYKKDINGLVVKLLQPVDVESNDAEKTFKLAKKYYKWTGNATKFIYDVDKEADSVYYALKAAINVENEIADNLIFGIEGTENLNELLRARNAMNESLILSGYINERIMVKNNFSSLTGKEAATETEVSLGSSFFSFKDLLDNIEYYIDVAKADRMYADSLKTVLEYTDDGLMNFSKLFPASIRNAANDTLNDYYAYYNEDVGKTFVNQVINLLETGGSNMVDTYFKKAIYGAGSLWISLEKIGLEALFHSTTATDTVRYMFYYDNLQNFFESCINKAMKKLDVESAVACRSAAVLYLKAALNSYANFSGSKLGELAVGTDTICEKITEHLVNIGSYPDGMFLVLKTKEINSGDLWNALEDRPATPISNGVFVKDAVRESGSDTLEYIDYSGQWNKYFYQYDYCVPQLVCDSEDASYINESIMMFYEDLLDLDEYWGIEGYGGYLAKADWECTVEKGIFLLRVDCYIHNVDADEYELYRSVYCLDSADGRQINNEEMLPALGFESDAVLNAAVEQIKHDFVYFWMQVSADEDQDAMCEAWDYTGVPDNLWQLENLWYDGQYFSFSWYIDNGSAYGAQVTVSFDPSGEIILFSDEEYYYGLPWEYDPDPVSSETWSNYQGTTGGSVDAYANKYGTRPVNHPKEYHMLNGDTYTVTLTKNDMYTDTSGNLWIKFAINEIVTLSTSELSEAVSKGRLDLSVYGIRNIVFSSCDRMPSTIQKGSELGFVGTDGVYYYAYCYTPGYWNVTLYGNTYLTYPGDQHKVEVAWDAITRDYHSPFACGDYSVEYYCYSDPREFFDRNQSEASANFDIYIEGGLITDICVNMY